MGNDGEQRPTRFPKMTKNPEVCSGGLQSHDRRASLVILMNVTGFSAFCARLHGKKFDIISICVDYFLRHTEFVINVDTLWKQSNR